MDKVPFTISGLEKIKQELDNLKKICNKEKKQSNCENNLKEKRSKLQKGNFIEIPVIPYQK